MDSPVDCPSPRAATSSVSAAGETCDVDMSQFIKYQEENGFENSSTPEKIIFCLDENLFAKAENQNQNRVNTLYQAVHNYMNIKSKTATKVIEFFATVLSNNTHELGFIPLTAGGDLKELFIGLSSTSEKENRPYDMGKLFMSLAQFVELPDPLFYQAKKGVPPHAYHVILMFGRNIYMPSLENPHPYYFLTDNPFFTLDILHFKDLKMKKNEQISKALSCLVSSKGYFYEHEGGHPQMLLNKLLAHTLIRSPAPQFCVNLMK